MADSSPDGKRISIRNLNPGLKVRRAYDDENRLLTEDVTIRSQIDIHQLNALGVRYVTLQEDSSQEEDREEEREEGAISRAELEEFLASKPDLVRKSEANYEKLIDHMKSIFGDSHEGEIELDRLHQLVPYLKKFIEFVGDSPASVSILTQIEEYDDYTYNHSINVSILAILFGKHRGFNQADHLDLAFGALLHDIGKMEVPRKIINKDGGLTEEEFKRVKKHPVTGAMLLEGEDYKKLYVRMAREHHERPDGNGYPQGITDIHPFSRILSVLDVYEAMTAPRSYKSPKVPLRAYQVLREEFYDYAETRDIVEELIKCIGVFPVGSLVRLTDGHVAVVQRNNQNDPVRPIVTIVGDKDDNVLSDPYSVDLDHVYHQKKLVHDHFYDDEVVIDKMILPESRSRLKEKINQVYDLRDVPNNSSDMLPRP